MNAPDPRQAVAILVGLVNDYGRLLMQQNNQTTASLVLGVAKDAGESIVTALRVVKTETAIDVKAP